MVTSIPPDLQVYRYDDWPKKMATRKQLSAGDMRLKPVRGWDAPDAAVTYKGGYLLVYKIEDCIPNPLTEKQQAAIAKRAATVQANYIASCICPLCGVEQDEPLNGGLCHKCTAERDARRLMTHAKDIVVLDTETTGLYTRNSEIISLAVVSSQGQPLLSTYLKPSTPIDEDGDACRINGITNAMVADAPTFADIYPALSAAIGDRLIVAYNAEFDSGFLMHACQLANVPEFDHLRWKCAMKIYSRWWGEYSYYWDNYSWQPLYSAVSQLKITRSGVAHSALSDALATQQVLAELSSRYKGA